VLEHRTSYWIHRTKGYFDLIRIDEIYNFADILNAKGFGDLFDVSKVDVLPFLVGEFTESGMADICQSGEFSEGDSMFPKQLGNFDDDSFSHGSPYPLVGFDYTQKRTI